jgi:pimeloyl-ACP methyl ester carboxylesterase
VKQKEPSPTLRGGAEVLRKVVTGLAVLFLVASVLPYLIPTEYKLSSVPEKPFSESRYAEVEGTTLHYRVWAPAAGEPRGKMLLVHGFGGSTFSWRENIEPLIQAGYLVMAVDLPGFGYSDRKSSVYSQMERSTLLWYHLASYDDTLSSTLTGKPWHLMGHSMGGGTVTAMAAEQPDRTASLILVAGAVFQGQRRGGLLFAYPPVQRWLKVALTHFLTTPANIERFLGSAYGRTPTPEEVEGYLAPLRLKGTGDSLGGFVRGSQEAPVDKVSAHSYPILAVWGENDSWVPGSQGLRLQAQIPRTQYVEIKDAAHCPMETNAKEFNDLLLAFLNVD